MSERLRWGILGTGNIARQFCTGVRASRRGELAVVGSRQADTAAAFARTYQIPKAVTGYDAVLADPAVEAVYVSLPNSLHHAWTLKALRAGKHVLCEKPLACHAREAREMFTAAGQARRVLIEAFMYRCHPLTHAVLEAVQSGAIGALRLIRTSFCYRTTKIAGNVRFSAELVGGGLMDVGCYCTSFARLVAGEEPSAVHAVGKLHPTGVDELVAGVLQFPRGVVATFSCGMSVHADNAAHICGSEGYIEIPIPWKPPVLQAAYTVTRSTPPRQDLAGGTVAKVALPGSQPRQTYHVDAGMELYGLEADAFAAVVQDGAPPYVTAQDSIGNMEVLDTLRGQIGLGF